MLVDLHIHSTCSDGIFSPLELLKMAEKNKVKVLALTDHDDINGYIEAKKCLSNFNLDIKLISGVEIDTNAIDDLTVHVLGYHFDPSNKALVEACAFMREGRVVRIKKMVDKVTRLGYKVTFEEVKKIAGDSNSIGRPHIARTLISKGYFNNIQEVFDKLLATGKPAYVKQEKLTPKEAVSVIHKAGGLASLAHPTEVNRDRYIPELIKENKFDAIEVWHPSAIENNLFDYWKNLAKELNILKSGGSDFHGDRYPTKLGEFKVLYDNLRNMIEYY